MLNRPAEIAEECQERLLHDAEPLSQTVSQPVVEPFHPLRGLRRVAQLAESLVGIVFCWAIGGVATVIPPAVAVVCAWGIVMRRDWPVAPLLCLLAAGIAVTVVHLSLFPVTLRALRRRSRGPLAIEAALLSPAWPRSIRPLATVWWVIMFLFSVFCAVSLEASSYMTPADYHQLGFDWVDSKPLSPGVAYLCLFGMAFAANTFLLLAVAPYTRDEPLLRRLWSLRFLLDVVAIDLPAWMYHAGWLALRRHHF